MQISRYCVSILCLIYSLFSGVVIVGAFSTPIASHSKQHQQGWLQQRQLPSRFRYPFRASNSKQEDEKDSDDSVVQVEMGKSVIAGGELETTSFLSEKEYDEQERFVSSREQQQPPPKQQNQQQQQQRGGDLSNQEMLMALGTSPRRIFLSLTSATGIALAGNLFGVTSNLLEAIPEDTVEASGLDTYFPRGDYKRYNGNDYTFLIPKEWVADTFVELAKAQRNVRPLDYKMERNGNVEVTLPDAAFGPPGRLNSQGVSQQGDINVSVIVSKVLDGFSLKGTLGDPITAAETLLRVSIAPEGSRRTATLRTAVEDMERGGIYQFEYDLIREEKKNRPLRSISVIATPSSNKNTLITLTVIAPQGEWENDVTGKKLRKIASSFHLRT